MSAFVSIKINDQLIDVNAGISVDAAIALSGNPVTRTSVTGQPRAPLCGMGICMECRVTIDGQAHQLACQTLCLDGMQISTVASS
ncbi:MAG: (2Fe-2S)-binding protein [Undibacterium sp.]|nr:(2Fe-2S)-binding protein [Undibacterium sp.]